MLIYNIDQSFIHTYMVSVLLLVCTLHRVLDIKTPTLEIPLSVRTSDTGVFFKVFSNTKHGTTTIIYELIVLMG